MAAGFIKDAEAKAKAELEKSTSGVRQYIESFVTSRVAMALSMALFVTFASTAFYAPNRLAPISSLGLAQYGLIGQAPTLDLSDFNVSAADQKQQTQDFVAQAIPQVAAAYKAAKAKYPALPLTLDILGAVASLAALAYTIKIQTRAARSSVRPLAL